MVSDVGDGDISEGREIDRQQCGGDGWFHGGTGLLLLIVITTITTTMYRAKMTVDVSCPYGKSDLRNR